MSESNKRLYVVHEFGFPHMGVYFVRATSLPEAIENYCLHDFSNAKKFKNGRWRWGGNYYDSAGELLASCMHSFQISVEIQEVLSYGNDCYADVFAGIDWFDLYYLWHDFYLKPKRRIGHFYEYYSENGQYYALFPSPSHFKKIIKKSFGFIIPEKKGISRNIHHLNAKKNRKK